MALAECEAEKTTRAAVYCRISQDSEGQGLGVGRQEKDARKLALQNGWSVTGVYVDNDLSAFSRKQRPEYARLLADVADGRIDAIVAWHPDRLHRSPGELNDFIDRVEEGGVLVETVQAGRVDLSTAAGRLSARIFGDFATYESEHKSERIKRKMEELAENGKPVGAARTFGYDRPRSDSGEPVRGSRPEVIPQEAARIEEAARRVLAGESLYAIIGDWAAAGVPTVRGGAWSTTALATILKSPRVAGLRVHQGKVVGPAEWDGILDRSTWEAVVAVLTDPARRRTRAKRSYLLTGMLRCGLCGHPLVATPRRRKMGGGARGVYKYEAGETQRAYGCVKANGGCGSVFVLAEPVEQFVTDAVAWRLAGDRLARARRRLDRRPPMHKQLERRVAEDEAALSELVRDYYVDQSMPREAYLSAKATLEGRLADARRELGQNVPAVAALGDVVDIEAEWPTLSLERRRGVISAVLDAATVGPATRVRNRFDPNRLSLVWRV